MLYARLLISSCLFRDMIGRVPIVSFMVIQCAVSFHRLRLWSLRVGYYFASRARKAEELRRSVRGPVYTENSTKATFTRTPKEKPEETMERAVLKERNPMNLKSQRGHPSMSSDNGRQVFDEKLRPKKAMIWVGEVDEPQIWISWHYQLVYYYDQNNYLPIFFFKRITDKE